MINTLAITKQNLTDLNNAIKDFKGKLKYLTNKRVLLKAAFLDHSKDSDNTLALEKVYGIMKLDREIASIQGLINDYQFLADGISKSMEGNKNPTLSYDDKMENFKFNF